MCCGTVQSLLVAIPCLLVAVVACGMCSAVAVQFHLVLLWQAPRVVVLF